MSVTVVVGEQRGDEGKGRFVDMLAEEHDVVARFNGGDNAGHTVVTPEGQEFALHGMPSGIVHPGLLNIIGNGCFVNPINLCKEIEDVRQKGVEVTPDNLKISSAAHLTLPFHISEDELREAGSGSQGSTKSGISFVAAARAMRTGKRIESINNEPDELILMVYEGLRCQRELREAAGMPAIDEKEVAKQYMASARQIGAFVTDTTFLLNKQLDQPGSTRILAEGAQAFLLDNDHGMYPFTTSSSTTVGGAITGLGVAPNYVDRVIGVSKAIQSHVGGGPFVTEITDKELLETLHGDMSTIDAEKGTTTGRVRRLGHLDLPVMRRSQMVNRPNERALTKLDWVTRYGQEVPICVSYTRKSKTYKVAPQAAYQLEESKPNYKYLPTWFDAGDIQGVRKFKKLPEEARKYIEFIEDQTDVPITMIGVGPQRDQVIDRRATAAKQLRKRAKSRKQ